MILLHILSILAIYGIKKLKIGTILCLFTLKNGAGPDFSQAGGLKFGQNVFRSLIYVSRRHFIHICFLQNEKRHSRSDFMQIYWEKPGLRRAGLRIRPG